MAQGDLSLFEPGASVDVIVVADVDGNVPQRGAAVEIVGTQGQRVEVSTLTAPGNFVGHLSRTPDEFDENENYVADDEVGETSLLLRHYVDWLEAEDVDTLSAGDRVVAGANGVRAYDPDPGTDTPLDVVGPVWTTAGRASGTAGKAAVVRRR